MDKSRDQHGAYSRIALNLKPSRERSHFDGRGVTLALALGPDEINRCALKHLETLAPCIETLKKRFPGKSGELEKKKSSYRSDPPAGTRTSGGLGLTLRSIMINATLCVCG